jgi:hypothetical protein
MYENIIVPHCKRKHAAASGAVDRVNELTSQFSARVQRSVQMRLHTI